MHIASLGKVRRIPTVRPSALHTDDTPVLLSPLNISAADPDYDIVLDVLDRPGRTVGVKKQGLPC